MVSLTQSNVYKDLYVKGNLTGPTVTSIDTELKRLDDLHNSDSLRLTTVENKLKNVDTDIKQQITDQIAQHNTDIANLDPRVTSIESKLQIDDLAKTITIPSDYRLVILGAFDIGTDDTNPAPPATPTPPPSGNNFGSAVDLTNPRQIFDDSQSAVFDSQFTYNIFYNNVLYIYGVTLSTGSLMQTTQTFSQRFRLLLRAPTSQI